MATLMVRLFVKPGMEARFETMITELVDQTLANETEVIRYEYWKGQAPRSWYAFLSFTSKAAFFVHQDADYHRNQPYDECVESMELEWLDPVSSASPLPRTQNPSLAANAPSNIAAWEQRSPIQLAPWWRDRQ